MIAMSREYEGHRVPRFSSPLFSGLDTTSMDLRKNAIREGDTRTRRKHWVDRKKVVKESPTDRRGFRPTSLPTSIFHQTGFPAPAHEYLVLLVLLTRKEGKVFTRGPPSKARLLRLASYATRDDAGEGVLQARPMIVLNAVDNASLSSSVVGQKNAGDIPSPRNAATLAQ